jgi:glucan 1,3-beta-glucosidase
LASSFSNHTFYMKFLANMGRSCGFALVILTLGSILAAVATANPISRFFRSFSNTDSDSDSGSDKRDAARPKFTWGSTPMRGVNIGGWLVLEPWITPSIFESVPQNLGIVDEYTLCQNIPSETTNILQRHWNTWVSATDFAKIAAAGVNVVRIPIGYWAFDNSGSPYVQGAAEYLEQALNWARCTTPPLSVIIDLHGAPGSQNGFDNSGQRLDQSQITFLEGGVGGQTAEQSINVLTQIAQHFGGAEWADVVVGIELLNEPIGWRLNNTDLRAWYSTGYDRVRSLSDATVVISDAFLPPSSWNGFLMPWTSGAQRVAMGSFSTRGEIC